MHASVEAAKQWSVLQLPVPVVLPQCSDSANGWNVNAANRRLRLKRKTQTCLASDSSGDEEQSSSEISRFQLALRRGVENYYKELLKDLKNEAGLDVHKLRSILVSLKGQIHGIASSKPAELKNSAKVLQQKVWDIWPAFVAFNKWGKWKNVKHWSPERVGAFITYLLLIAASLRGLYTTAPRIFSKTPTTHSEAVTTNDAAMEIQGNELLMNKARAADYLTASRRKYVKRSEETNYGRGFWVAKRWWKYRPNLPYTYFLKKVKNFEVEAAVYNPDATRLYVTMKNGFPSEYTVDIPADPYLAQLLTSSHVDIDVIPQSRLMYMLRAAAIVVPCVALLIFLDRQHQKFRHWALNKLHDLAFSESSVIVMPWKAKEAGFPTFNDVVVDNDVWGVVEEVSIYLKDPMQHFNKSIPIPRGILIHGPPGTGKTHLARAMARELNLPFVFASGSEFGDDDDLDGAEKIFNLFFTARANAPALVFIDEIDALAGRHVDEDFARRDTFERLLTELDGSFWETEVDRFAPRQAVILVCATNRREDLHEQFLQAGRIDRELKVGLPREEERIKIFGVHSAGLELADDVNFSKVVYRTRGYSGADIRNFVSEAALLAKQKGRTEIRQQDLLDILEKQLLEAIGLATTEEEQKSAERKVPPAVRRLLAVHEAGHVLLAHLFPKFDWHAFSHILPAGQETAFSTFYPSEEQFQMGATVGYLKMQMTVAHGGRVAEKLLLGEVTDGGQDDLLKISRLAREIATSRANPRLGLYPILKVQPAEGVEPFIPDRWERPNTYLTSMPCEVTELLTREITGYIDQTEGWAMEGLKKNIHILRKIADEFEKNVKLTGDEVEEIMKNMNPKAEMLPNLLDVKTSGPRIPGMEHGFYMDLDVFPAPLHRC